MKRRVTILILIDGFLQYVLEIGNTTIKLGHNPYFNRWFSAIGYINRLDELAEGHNPYFNRWFSAIKILKYLCEFISNVTILILIDGFLQCKNLQSTIISRISHNPYFNRWFSAIEKKNIDMIL